MDHPEASGRAYNLGGVEEISMEGLAQRIIDAAGPRSKIRYVPYDEACEEGFEDMQRRVPNTTRARELVGFAPQVGLDEILRHGGRGPAALATQQALADFLLMPPAITDC